jgi:hypothetical protein
MQMVLNFQVDEFCHWAWLVKPYADDLIWLESASAGKRR